MQWEADKNYAKLHGWHDGRHELQKQEMDAFLQTQD